VNDLYQIAYRSETEHDYEVVLKPPEVASLSPRINTLVPGAWLREKRLYPERTKVQDGKGMKAERQL
jgi:hypothetical protein